MFITVKKTSILICLFIILCIAAMIIALRSGGASDAEEAFSPGAMTIVVDAGHGGMDSGAVGVSGVLEKDITLAVAKKLGELIVSNGGKVIYTREEDVSIHDAGSKTIRAQKRSDLKNRFNIAQNSGAHAFVSIHMNKFEQSQYRGAQIFYAKNSVESEGLARQIKKGLDVLSDYNKNRELKEAYDTMFLLKNVKIPSVIVECGFLSNPEEEKLLCSDEYQRQLAQKIFEGLTAE